MYRPIQYIDHTRLNDNVHYREYLPSPSLAEYVACYWVLDRPGGAVNIPYRIIPDGCIDVIFDFEKNTSIISGINNETAYLLLNGRVKRLGVRFLPKATPFILRSDASEFLNNGFETEFGVRSLHRMSKKVLDAAEVYPAIKIIQEELDFFFRDFTINKRFTGILENALYSKGCITVSDLASYHGISEKQVTRYFKENVGLTTKEFLRIVRFQNLLLLIKNRQSDMLRGALDLGYYDQSHLIKDLKRYLSNTSDIF